MIHSREDARYGFRDGLREFDLVSGRVAQGAGAQIISGREMLTFPSPVLNQRAASPFPLGIRLPSGREQRWGVTPLARGWTASLPRSKSARVKI